MTKIFISNRVKGNKRKRNDRFADTRHHETPVYGRDEQSPQYGRDKDFHNYGSKRDDVYSEFFGTDMLMSDTGPVAKTDKIFLNHSPMKGSQTRVKRHLHTHLHTHYIKSRHRRDDVYSEFFGTDMLMSDTGPVAKTDKIFLNHSPMKGSQTRVKRHLHTHLHTHYIKSRHRRENEDHIDEQSKGESAPSTKNDTKVNFNIFTPELCG